jgi:hypothetical protein
MHKRRLKLIGKILLGIVLILVAFLLVERWRGQIALASFKKQLLANGEKLSPLDFVQDFNEADNGAPAVMAAIQKLQPGRIIPTSLPPRMQMCESGRAIVGFRELEWIASGVIEQGKWVDRKITNRWDQVARDLAQNSTVFAELEVALAQPVFDNHLDYSLGPKMKSPHLGSIKNLVQWLQCRIAYSLHTENRADALAGLACEIQLPKLIAKDRVLIGELFRNAICAIALTDTWEALQFEGWSDPELAHLQDKWATQSFIPQMINSMERELINMILTFETYRASNKETYQTLALVAQVQTAFQDFGGPEEAGGSSFLEDLPLWESLRGFWQRQIYCRVWRFAWSHQAERRALGDVYTALELMRRQEAAQSWRLVVDEFEVLEQDKKYGHYDRLRFIPFDLLSTYAKAAVRPMRSETDRSLCRAAIALQRYFLRCQSYPESLDALVPEFLSSVPTDYMDGQPIKYRLNTDGSFTLYSVGTDGVDNGGDTSPPDGSKSRIRWLRKDYVWPAPATPEEVEEFRQQALAD